MYKRLKFRYQKMSFCFMQCLKRSDKTGCVCVLLSQDLSFKIVEIGKSDFISISRNDGEFEFFNINNANNSVFQKSFVEWHFLTVPQTDTGALVENTKASG